MEEQQQQYWKQVGPRTIALLDKGNTLLDSSTALIGQTKTDEQQVSGQLVGVLEATHQTLDSTNALVQDKAIKQTLANLDASTSNAVQITQHLDSTANHIDGMSLALEKRVDQMLKPASLVKRIFMTLLRVAADTGTVYRSF